MTLNDPKLIFQGQAIKYETKNKLMSVIGPVQSRYHEGRINLRWEGFVEKVGFEPGVKRVKE